MNPANRLRILVTGATGFLGSRLVWTLWRKGHTLWLLTRTASPPPMRAHLAALAGLFGSPARRPPPSPAWLAGNTLLPRAGVAADWIESRRGQIDAIVHLAADTRLRPVRPVDQSKTNVDGTMNVADLAEGLGCPSLHHVSACSVAGTHVGIFREEDLEVGQLFRTHLEETKAEAERRLRHRAESAPFRLTVHRPATLVGDSTTGGAATFPPFYQLLAAWHRLAASGSREKVTVPFSADSAISLIPVDHVAEGIAASLVDSRAGGATYHWAPHEPVTLGALSTALARLLGAPPLLFDPNATWPLLEETSPAQPLWAWLQMHRAYLNGGLILDRTHADALCGRAGVTVPLIDDALLARLHRHWAWAKGNAVPPTAA